MKNVFLVRGKKSYTLCGAKEIFDAWFTSRNCRVTEFFDFEENPKYEDVLKGLELLHTANAEAIFAVGGGSVLDMAKLIRFFNSYTGDPTGTTFAKEKDLIPLYAMPTTAGTGCEVTQFAVMYIGKVKYSVAHPDILPDKAILYPPFTYNNPPYLTACTGFDALAQAIEAWWNKNATPESDQYALKAIRLLWPNLPLAVHSPNKENRDALSTGAYWAGKAINITKTTAPHAISYGFTSYYGIPHGHAVALTFPFFFSYNVFGINSLKSNELKTITGCQTRQEAFAKLKNYINGIGLTNKAFPEKPDKALILSGVNYKRLSNNPIAITKEVLSEAFDSIHK